MPTSTNVEGSRCVTQTMASLQGAMEAEAPPYQLTLKMTTTTTATAPRVAHT